MSSASDKNRGQVLVTRPIQFQAFLPEIFRPDATDENGRPVNDFLNRFLNAFQVLFEGVEGEIEGTPGNDIRVTFVSGAGHAITVAPFQSGDVGFPTGAAVTVPNSPDLRSTTTNPIPANSQGLTEIDVDDAAFVSALKPNDILEIHAGGVPDLFNADTTPPPQFSASPSSDFDYMSYLASWVAQSLRTDAAQLGSGVGSDEVRGTDWNREFFKKAVPLYPRRGTLSGIDALLRAWMKGDLLETSPPLLILTDLTRTYNDVNAVLQLAPQNENASVPGETYAQVGVNTSLCEGPPFFFIADLVTNPTIPLLRTPLGLEALQSAARSLLDSEKPSYTYYQLRVRGPTMQLAPPDPVPQPVVVSTSGTTIAVSPFNTGAEGYPAGAPVIVPSRPTLGTTLSKAIPPGVSGETDIEVSDVAFAELLQKGDVLGLSIWAQLGVSALVWDEAWVYESDC